MLATIREYALEQLEARGEMEALSRRHADYYLALARRAEPRLKGPEQRLWADRLEAEYGNLRATVQWALGHGEVEMTTQLVWALFVFWWVRGHFDEVRQWLEEVLAAPHPLPSLVRAQALSFARGIASFQGNPEEALADLEESLSLFKELGHKQGMGLTLLALAISLPASELERKEALLEESLQLFRELEDDWSTVLVLTFWGRLVLSRGDVARAQAIFEESLSLAQALEDSLSANLSLHSLGGAALLEGDLPRAEALFQESVRVAVKIANQEGAAYGVEGLAMLAAAQDDVARAARLLGAAEVLRETVHGSNPEMNFILDERVLAELRTRIDEEIFDSAWAEGRAMTFEEAVRYALDGSRQA